MSTTGSPDDGNGKKKKTFRVWPTPSKPDQPYGPTPKQRLLFIDELPEEERPHKHPVDVVLYIGGARCHGRDTAVLMFDGTTKVVQDIVVGDLLMGPDSLPRTVKALSTGWEDLYKVIPNKGEPFTCNASHVLPVKTNEPHGKHLDAEMEVWEFYSSTKNFKKRWKLWRSGVDFPEKSLPLDPYFVGLWLGDGHSNAPAVTTVDAPIIDYMYRFAERVGLSIRAATAGSHDGNCFSYFLTSGSRAGGATRNGVTAALRDLQILGNKHIPLIYMTGSKEQRRALLAGLADSDGYANNSCLEFCLKNFKLADQIAFLARSLGLAAYTKDVEKTCTNSRWGKQTRTYRKVSISGDMSELPTLLMRKQFPKRVRDASVLVTGFDIEYLGPGEVYGFELAGPDSLYLLGSLTVAHNSGKTTGATARVLSFLLKNKGAVAVVGATNFPLLQRTALKEWTDRFTNVTPWDYLRAKPPIILKKPTQNDKRVILANGSQAFFLHFDNPEVLRGIDADIIHFEEACLLPDEAAFEELTRRLSGRKGKVRQLILTTNPEARGGWIHEKFKLGQLSPGFTGVPEPLCNPCTCHLCQDCLNKGKSEDAAPEYVEGYCPDCGGRKENDCPGNQTFMRIIQTATMDNKHIPQDHAQTQKAFMDKKSWRVFVEGSTEDVRDGEVYKAYSDDNILKGKEPISYDRDLIWTLDFNFEPQCSVILQEEETSLGFRVKVLDEIILWNALPEHAAQEFCEREEIRKWKENSDRSVLVYGDPAGLYGTGNNLTPSFYQIIYEVLTKHGFDVRIMMRKPDPNALVKEGIKIPVAGRVDAMNAMLCTAYDDPDNPPQRRLFINPHCKHVIRSLRELRWAEDGKNIDKSVDKNAARALDKNKIHLMTHPTDALGYYVYKRFPVLKNKPGVTIFQVPGESVVQYREGHVYEYDRTSKAKEAEARRDERKKKREERRRLREAAEQQSIGGWLRHFGLWPGY